jgi:hypothetical protein
MGADGRKTYDDVDLLDTLGGELVVVGDEAGDLGRAGSCTKRQGEVSTKIG